MDEKDGDYLNRQIKETALQFSGASARFLGNSSEHKWEWRVSGRRKRI